MVAALTWGKKGLEDRRPQMERVGQRAQALKDGFVQSIDRDTEAFNRVLAARRLPAASDDERAAREAAIDRANLEAIEVPLEVLARAVDALEAALAVAQGGLPSAVSDAGVAGACALAAAEGAALNVRVNLVEFDPAPQAVEYAARVDNHLGRARTLAGQVRAAVDEALAEPKDNKQK